MKRENIIYVLKLIGVTLLVYLVFRYILKLVIPFIIAFVIALIIEKPVSYLERRWNIRRVISSTLIMVVITVADFFFLRYLAEKLIMEVKMFMKNYGIINKNLDHRISCVCENIDGVVGAPCGQTRSFINENVDKISEGASDMLTKNILNNSIPILVYVIGAVGIVIIIFIAVILFSVRMKKIKEFERKGLFSGNFKRAKDRLCSILITYARTQGILMLITAGICTLGLFLAGNPYALLAGIIIGFLDALPLIGSGIILVPLCIIQIISGKYAAAVIVAITYAICYILRQVLEPKLMGEGFGVGSLEMMISMYVGLLLFGIWGFLLGPTGYIIIKEIVKQ